LSIPPERAEEVQRVPPALKEHGGAEDPVDGARHVDRPHREHGHAREDEPHRRVVLALEGEDRRPGS